jgi:hypothetical protein
LTRICEKLETTHVLNASIAVKTKKQLSYWTLPLPVRYLVLLELALRGSPTHKRVAAEYRDELLKLW